MVGREGWMELEYNAGVFRNGRQRRSGPRPRAPFVAFPQVLHEVLSGEGEKTVPALLRPPTQLGRQMRREGDLAASAAGWRGRQTRLE